MSSSSSGRRVAVASSSAGMRDMPTSAPAPAMAAPNKPLVDELMEARRERYKRARLQDGSALCQVFPLLPSRNAAAVEPVAADRQASTAPAQHGLLEAVQAGEEESNEKVEGRSTAHLLLRVLALSYVVPLCDLSDIGVPESLTRQGYSAQDSLHFMHSLLKEQHAVVEHVFKSRPEPHQLEGSVHALESTTLDVWLAPRLVTAAAVLSVRSSGLLTGASDGYKALQTSLINLAQELLHVAVERPAQVCNVRLLLVEFLRASLRSLTHIGRPSFLPSAPPPIKLLPREGAHSDLASFFTHDEHSAYQASRKAYGDGMNRLWMKEDHSSFEPPLETDSLPVKSLFARVLLLFSCQLCCKLATVHPAELSDIGDQAASLFLSNWQCDMAIDTRVLTDHSLPGFLIAQRIELSSSIVTTQAVPSLCTPTVERLSLMVAKQVAAMLGEDAMFPELAIRALLSAMVILRKARLTVTIEAATYLRPHVSSLISHMTRNNEGDRSGMQMNAEDRKARDQRFNVKALALEAFLMVMKQDADPRLVLDASDRRALVDAFAQEDTESMSVDIDVHHPTWMNDEQHRTLSAVLEGSQSGETATFLQPKSLPVTVQAILEAEGLGKIGPPSADKALQAGDDGTLHLCGRLFCAAASTVERTQGGLHCSLCDTLRSPFKKAVRSPGMSENVVGLSQVIRTVERALRQTALVTSLRAREACVQLLCRRINHARAEEVSVAVVEQGVSSLIRLGLLDKSRRLRLLTGKLAAAFSAKQSELEPLGHAPLRTRVSSVFSVFREILKSGHAKAKETALLGLARLGEIGVYEVQEQTLLLLVLQLGTDPLQKALAYTIISDMASQRRCTNFQLLAPSLDVISAQIIERIHSTPTLFLEVLQLTNQNQSTFLQTTLSFTLPHVLELQSEKTLSLIARGIGQDIQTMCFNATPAILKYFLMQPATKRDRGIHTFIQTVRGGGAHDIDLRSLLKSYSVELLGHLVTQLGYPEFHDAARAGLHHMNSTLNDRHGANKSTSSKDMALSAFLKDEILAILSWLNDELMNGHGKKTMQHKYWVARSIGELIKVVGQSISVVTPQLMATMNTTMQVNELMLPTLESWRTFITELGFAVVGPFIGQTAAALVASWPRFGPQEKDMAKQILAYIVVESIGELRPFLEQDFPSLEELRPDIPDICNRLATIGSSAAKRPEQRLQHILDRAANENSSVCGQALGELKTFLTRERVYLQRITSGNTFDPVVGKIIHVLFAIVARDEEADSLRDLCLENLGILGAVDPDRFKHDGIDQRKELLQDFGDKDEVGDFAVHLIRDLLVSAFKATNDTKHQAALAYAIQELLKLAGFSSALLPQNGTNVYNRGATVSLRVRQRWTALPPAILDIIAPLLESKYSVHLGDISNRAQPIYLHSSSFKEWVQHWTNHLILGAHGDYAKAMFTIFRSVIRDHDLSIAQYILPHLVVNILVLGTEEQTQEIREEIVAVLEDQVKPTTTFEPERRLLCAQVVFALFDHMSVWMRTRSHHKQKQSRRMREETDSALMRVDSLLCSISQELMATASLKCRAYARSLLNFEQRIRALKGQGKQDGELQQHYENMHLIYAKLDEPDGMEGISTRVISPSLEHQIREHESTGRWTSAQSCWEVKIQDKQDDLELHLGLLRCLRNLGHYDTMRTHIRGVLAVHPLWERRLDSFYVEGCCILSDWAEVKKRLVNEGSGQYSPEHATARVMLAMHEDNQDAFKRAMKDARSLLGKPLVAVGKNSYVSVYDSVTQLHMLYELGMISEAFGLSSMTSSSDSPLTLPELGNALAARLDSTLPSFRTREPLLSLRRSAFSTRSQTAFRAEIGESWISSSKIARRAGHTQTAYSAALQASQCRAPFAFVQQAKLLVHGDQGQAALQEISNALQNFQLPNETSGSAEQQHSFANAHLFLARLADQSGRSGPNEIIERYKACTELDPQSEKMWYYLGHYYDQGAEREQGNTVKVVANVFTQHLNTCRYLLKSALYGTKFFYRSLPRVLTIWLDCGADESLISALKAKSTAKEPSADVQSKLASFRTMNDLIRRAGKKLAAYQWLAVFPQLFSRVVHKNEMVWKTLIEVICHVTEVYPHQAMWAMVAGSQSKDSERRKRFNDIITRIKGNTRAKPGVTKIIDQTLRMATELLYLCDFPVGKETKLSMPVHFPKLLALADAGELILPLQSSVSVNLPGNHKTDSDHRAFEKDLPRIIGFEHNVDVMSSLQKPRKIIINASDGKHYPFLCKPNDDLRKDARLMEFDNMINNLLQSNSESRKRRLYIRTYSVITLNEVCGLIEWVPNTIGLRHILSKLYHVKGIPLYSTQVQADMNKARADPRNAGEIFEKNVLSKYPSVFHEWFVASFPEPSAWLKARLAYAHTLAVMSMVGHVLGLGDRHGENVLFDSESGDTVHVDLNCLFDKGTAFDIPERVPFRLTHNLVDALGVTGYEGVFRRAAEISMGILRENKDSLMSVLEAMVHDPLVEWGIDHRGKSRVAGQPDPRMIEARRSLDPVMQKLNGKLKRSTNTNGDPLWTTAYSTNSLVDALIRDATSNTLLAQMYVGWASYL